jgi:hypothetical protein
MTSRRLENEVFVKQVADAICRFRLRLPALISLETGRPLAFLGGQLLWMGQPLLGLFLSPSLVGRVAQLLEEPESVDSLIELLEAREG